MAASIGIMELLILLLAGGGGNDVLDFVETKSYWGGKNVEMTVGAMIEELKAGPAVDVKQLIKTLGNEDFNVREEAARKILAVGPAALPQLKAAMTDQDPEVASQAKRLILQLNSSAMARSVRRLMAIRTLGELKDAAALSALKPLLDSKELFEADYAQQAIAALEGKPYARKRPDAKLLLQDLRCLPKACGVLARFEMQPGAPLDIARILAGAEGLPPGFDKDKSLAQLQQMVIQFAERVGNIRLEGITFGLSEEVGPDTGFAIFVARGLFDRDAVCAALKEMTGKVEMAGGQEVFSLERAARLMLPSNKQVALIAGPPEKQLPLEPFVEALKEPPLQLGQSKELAALLDTVEKDAPVWAVARMSKCYREAPFFAPFDSITLQGKQVEGSQALALHAIGQDAEKVGGAVKMFEEGVKEALAAFKNDEQMGKILSSVGDFLRSIQTKQDGQEVRVTAKMKGANVATVIPFMFFANSSSAAKPVPMPAK